MSLGPDSVYGLKKQIVANAAQAYPECVRERQIRTGATQYDPGDIFEITVKPQTGRQDPSEAVVSLKDRRSGETLVLMSTGEQHSIKEILRVMAHATEDVIHTHLESERLNAWWYDNQAGPNPPAAPTPEFSSSETRPSGASSLQQQQPSVEKLASAAENLNIAQDTVKPSTAEDTVKSSTDEGKNKEVDAVATNAQNDAEDNTPPAYVLSNRPDDDHMAAAVSALARIPKSESLSANTKLKKKISKANISAPSQPPPDAN